MNLYNILLGAVYIIIAGVIAAAWLPSMLLDKLFRVGVYPTLSTVIGSVIGLVVLHFVPTHGGVAMIVAGVCSIVSSIIQDKIL